MVDHVKVFVWYVGRLLPLIHVVGFGAYSLIASAQEIDSSYPQLTALKDGREQIWAYRVRGQLKREYPTSQGKLGDVIEFFSAGNYLDNKFRFDYERQIADVHDKSNDGHFATSGTGSDRPSDMTVTKQIWKTDGVIQWSSETAAGLVHIRKPDRVSVGYRPFDVRAIGFVTAGDLSHFTRFDEAWKIYIADGVLKHQSAANQQGEVVVEAKLGHSGGFTPLTLWMTLDLLKDSVPVEVRFFSGRTYDELKLDVDSITPDYLVTTEWLQVGGSWVPKTCTIAKDIETPQAELSVYEFSWESVNEDLAPSLFEVTGFEFNQSANVIDERHGQPVLVEIIDRGDSVAAVAVRQSTWQFSYYCLAAGGLLVLLAVGVAVLRRRTRE